ncbi:uncharacterized protein LOC108468758 [Gossypium arboreum]|uniref:uncharacterized protein LOC108468758 n=1 Tax=Gossypium arboreum TaxID=29729 RepID=UPI0008190B6C|nr:uncharacterized protein LOC108468758 [Gossypium arboreum]
METNLAGLTLNEDKDAVLQIQVDQNTNREEEVFRLVGYFLTTSIIHFPAMKSTMENLWHPVRGVQIRDLGEKRFLFQFYYVMDMERVLKGSHWSFNNHLLLLHKLQWWEDPLKVPLILAPFWIQIHDVPIDLFSENLAIQMGSFLGDFIEYDGSNLGKENRNYMRIRVQIDVRRPLKMKKQIMFQGRCAYVRFKCEILSLFCFYYGRPGHNDSFCEAKMALGVEIAELRWDLSLRAQSRRALVMNSVWLREEGEGGMQGNGQGNYKTDNVMWTAGNKNQ